MSADLSEAQVQVRFVTKQEQYAVSDSPYAIQSNVQSSDLNSLVNALLKEFNASIEKAIEFDFLVCGELLCTSLAEHLQEKGASTEETLEIEYFERFPAPSPQDCLMHDDWVSAVQARGNCGKTSRTINQEQHDTLLAFFEKHQALARGQLRSYIGLKRHKQLWAHLTHKLNSLNGCVKSTAQWQKFWADKKYLARKAAVARKMALDTGSEPSSTYELNETELRILAILEGNSSGAYINAPKIWVDKKYLPGKTTVARKMAVSTDAGPSSTSELTDTELRILSIIKGESSGAKTNAPKKTISGNINDQAVVMIKDEIVEGKVSPHPDPLECVDEEEIQQCNEPSSPPSTPPSPSPPPPPSPPSPPPRRVQQKILSGSYDNNLHIWSTKGQHKLAIPGHTSPVKAVSWVSFNDDEAVFISGSHDQSAMLWVWNVAKNSVDCVVTCRSHDKGVESLSVSADALKFATGSWDSNICLWSTSLSDEDNVPAKKRSKPDHGSIRGPLSTLKGHREAVTGVLWMDFNTLLSSSWDHLLKLWDCELGGIKQEIAGNKAYFSVDWSPLNNGVITSSADRHIRLYDPRSTESIVKTTFTSHTSWVQSVRWSKTRDTLFLSAGFDGKVKLWETRSPRTPLYDLSGHEDKVLCCDWSNPSLLVSGSCDNTLRIFKAKHAVGNA